MKCETDVWVCSPPIAEALATNTVKRRQQNQEARCRQVDELPHMIQFAVRDLAAVFLGDLCAGSIS